MDPYDPYDLPPLAGNDEPTQVTDGDGLPTEEEMDKLLSEDIKDSALTGNVLTRELFPPYKTVFMVNNSQFSVDLTSNDIASPRCSIIFRTPHDQRSALVLRVVLAREQNRDSNPKGLRSHSIFIYIPVPAISTLTYTDPANRQQTDPPFATGEGFLDGNEQPHPLATLAVVCRGAFVQGGAIPQLATQDLTDRAKMLVSTIRADEVHLLFLIRDRDALTRVHFDEFYQRSQAEFKQDPALAWIKDSPHAHAFTMGTLREVHDRPLIPPQRAETVFYDKMAYLVPVVYGAVYEEELQEILCNEFTAASFEMTVIELPNARNVDNSTPDPNLGPTVESSACIYIGFIDFADLELVRPNTGERLRVTLDLPETMEEQSQAKDTAATSPSGGEEEGDRPEEAEDDDDTDPGEDPESPGKGYDPVQELGNDDLGDVFDDEDPELKEEGKNVWSATIIETCDATPSGHLTIMLERRRQPGWQGPHHLRPFVSTKLTAVNFAHATSVEQLQRMIQDGPKIKVKLATVYSKQGLKDMVRCADELWRSEDPQKKRIRRALLCHNPDQSPLATVDLTKLKGTYTYSDSLNVAQLQYYASLDNVPEISLLHGPFGTGKTHTCITIAAEIATSAKKQPILYLVETNKAVDEVALRFDRLFGRVKGDTKVVRLHSLPGEKTSVYPHFSNLPRSQDRFLDDGPGTAMAELALTAYLNQLGTEYRRVRARGDPRRVCTELSLSTAMYKILRDTDHPDWIKLRGMLSEYGQDGFFNTEAATRTEIKLALNDLMAFTIQQQDVIVCTLATAAKVNLAANFNPVLVILDEAARIPELRSLIPLGMYSPQVFILAGDHIQQLPYCQSYGRDRDTTSPYLNPFAAQQLLSTFERLIRNGTEHTLLYLQHRCLGDIQTWVSDTFYHGQVKEAPQSEVDKLAVAAMRTFCRSRLGTYVLTNRYARNIQNSRSKKEEGGTSSINEEEARYIEQDLLLMSEDPAFQGKSIAVLSFYKAQLVSLKRYCNRLRLNTTFIDASTLTVASAQGTEYDVVLLSVVTTHRVAFVNEPHALVVALTRARLLLGIYTNWKINDQPKKNTSNGFILSLLDDLQKKNHVIDCGERAEGDNMCYNCGENGHNKRECPNDAVYRCRRCQENNDEERMWGHRASECTYYSRAVTCRRCDENNHPQDDPPHATKECPHFERSPSELRCRGCSQIGHLRATCPLVTCNRCGAPGHIVSGCPQPIICAKCKLPGHIARLCTTVISRAYLQTVRPIQDAYNPRDELRDLGDQPLNPAPVCAPGDGLGTGEVGTDKETGWGLGSDDGTADGDADASGWGKAQPMPGGGGW